MTPPIQWWCSAKGTPWTGTWQGYPGVWLFVALTGAGLWRLTRGSGGRPRWREGCIGATVLLLWGTLDWPVGPLGAGYLMWVHAAQFIVLAMIIPPVFLLGLGDDGARRLNARPGWQAVIRAATDPLPGIVLFAAVMVISHLPSVVDGLMKRQLGAFALDAAWFLSGILFWWPIILTEPARPKFVPLLQMVYLFFGTQPHLYIAMWLLLGDFPKYATYELAPRMSSLTALQDQAVGGGLMLCLTLPIVFGVLSVIFIRWVRREPA